jgi:short-subunit dehydrogenase
MTDSISGKVALITGASAGIGAALAREFAARGCSLVLTARRSDRLEELAAELRQGGTKVLVARADVTQDGELEAVVSEARQQLGGVDIVVANAGFGVMGKLHELAVDDVRRQLETNLFGVLRTLTATRDELLARRGRFAIVGSISGYLCSPGVGAYSMSKFALRAYADVLRQELRPLGVSVTHLIPGFIESEIRQVDNRGTFHEQARDPVPKWIQMPTAKAARQMVDAVAARCAARVITGHGKVLMLLGRHAQWLVDLLVRFGVGAHRGPVGE